MIDGSVERIIEAHARVAESSILRGIDPVAAMTLTERVPADVIVSGRCRHNHKPGAHRTSLKPT
jgi:hypothetical protein